MSQFMNVLCFEMKNYLQSKVYIVITVVLVLMIGIVSFLPHISGMFTGGSGDTGEQERGVIALSDIAYSGKESVLRIFTEHLPDYDFEVSDLGVDQLRAAVEKDEYHAAIILEDTLRYAYITKNLKMYNNGISQINKAMNEARISEVLSGHGMDQNEITEYIAGEVSYTLIETGKNQAESFTYTYFVMIILFMSIVMYGQFVAMSIASEKGSRAMEILITTVKPATLMFGKVIGSGLAGLLQMVVILSSGILFTQLSGALDMEGFSVQSFFNIPAEILVFSVLFFILGYFIYAFIFGALGSLASSSEEINTVVMPATFIALISFYIVIFSVSSGNVGSTLMKICSFIPFTSPMAMLARMSMENVGILEVIASVVILTAAMVGIGYMAAGIYRAGVLMYGKPPKLSELIKIIKQR